jgi:N-acetylglutamate synthase-like GNAT family acetyltransferase
VRRAAAREGTGRSARITLPRLSVASLAPSGFAEAQAFYRSVDYSGVISRDDFVVGAKSERTLVGLARLCFDQGCLTLRGMQVTKALQRCGIGSLLLDVIEKRIADEQCFCLPHDWLGGFYGQIGFERIDPTQAPMFLQDRLQVSREKHTSLIVMRRQGAGWRRDEQTVRAEAAVA